MKKKGVKFNNNLIYLAIVIIVILMLVFGRRGGEEIEVLEENLGLEESAGSGFLEIETFPSDAEIFLDDDYNGKSPLTIYNVPAGIHNVVIKRDGYEDFVSEVSLEAGRKAFLEASLVLTEVEEKPQVTDIIEGDAEVIGVIEEKKDEETLTEPLKCVNIGKKFLLYYDFSERKFTDKRNFDQDIFSKRYAKHLVFTGFNPVNIKTIDKSIDNVEKEDCAGIKGQFEFLNSGQSLCVITKEDNIVALGGTWGDTKDAELKWKVFR